MRLRYLVAAFGMALGTALAAGPTAGADALDEAWPYPDFSFPGFSTGNLTQNGPFIQGELDYNLFPESGEYSTHYTAFSVRLVIDNIHQEVFTSSGVFPPVGTTMDQFYIFNDPELLSNTYINDPTAGVGDRFTFFFLQNTYISDTAGTQDVLSIFGHDFTLFDFPAMSAGAVAEAPAALGMLF